ncbi:MAG TPA: hypothetical protein VGQ99_14035 [Tepidisphaeraceae bacterium]|jgi:hypothetical protein|nr:hypothetical protein [Tepidisphaeraceae bacterium]
MRWAIATIVLLVIAGVPAAMAAKKDMKEAPGKAAVAKAGAKATFQKDNAATHTFASGKSVTFVPCDIGHLNEEEFARGAVIGKLELQKGSKDGLEPGVYRVFLRKPGNHWQAFFCQDDKPVACAEDVQAGLDNEHKPKFVDAGTAIRYGWFKFSY